MTDECATDEGFATWTAEQTVFVAQKNGEDIDTSKVLPSELNLSKEYRYVHANLLSPKFPN